MSDDHLSPAALRVAAGLVVVLAAGAVVAGLVLSPAGDDAAGPGPTNTKAPRTGPVALVGVDAPDAASASCTGLMKALPEELADRGDTLTTLPLADPAPPAASAWGGDGGEPVVLRCGLLRPDELTPASALREISGVRWLPVEGDGSTTWYVVDRAVYVALTVPAGSGTGPLQDVSAAAARALPAKPVRTNG